MKKLTGLLCIVFVILMGCAAFAFEGHDIPWGDDISAFGDLTFSHEAGGIKYYNVNGEKVCDITKISAAKITYGFKGDKLYARIVNIGNAPDLDKLHNHFTDSFGRPELVKEEGWTIKKWTQDDVKIKLKENDEETLHKFGMYYLPLAG